MVSQEDIIGLLRTGLGCDEWMHFAKSNIDDCTIFLIVFEKSVPETLHDLWTSRKRIMKYPEITSCIVEIRHA